MRPYKDVRAACVQRHAGMTTPSVMLALAAAILMGGATCAFAAQAAHQHSRTHLADYSRPTGSAAPGEGSQSLLPGAGTTLPGHGPGGPQGSPRPFSGFHIDVASSNLNVLSGHLAYVNGYVRPGVDGLTVALQVRRQRHWTAVARTLTGARGRFELRFAPSDIGTLAVRLRIPRNRLASVPGGADCVALSCASVLGTAATIRPQVRRLGTLNVFRLAMASYYGGGGSLACGGWLTSSTMGVANKTLPCGTMVTLRYNGRTVRVPVVDRGPYVAGREFDLTEATKNALGFPGLGVVWSTS